MVIQDTRVKFWRFGVLVQLKKEYNAFFRIIHGNYSIIAIVNMNILMITVSVVFS